MVHNLRRPVRLFASGSLECSMMPLQFEMGSICRCVLILDSTPHRHFEKEPRRLPCNHRKPKKKRVTGEKESNAVQSGKKPILRTMAKWLAPLASGPEADATSTRSSECPIIIRASSRQECSNFTVENARVPDR
ncbi:unnamed protein product [Effrenium voratum]|nr:unnamed protein product [Effrenium voratum]